MLKPNVTHSLTHCCSNVTGIKQT